MKKWNYYNDTDPKVCAWAKELIKAKLVPDGEVDCRSIEDIRPDEIKDFIQCHFFCGILGWPLALRLSGWPDDKPVWTGSCPCQPFSTAGKGAGSADKRHLWPAFKWLIEQCQPSIIFGEQVASEDGREWLAGVRADLEDVGFTVGAADLCAASVKAKHIRQRLWWVANSQRNRRSEGLSWSWGPGRMGREQQPISWDRTWQCALREFRAVDDGLSYGVVGCNGPRNAIVPQVAAEFIQASFEAISDQATASPDFHHHTMTVYIAE